MSVLIKGLNIKPCDDGFGGRGLVIIGYDDKLYAVAHEQIVPFPDGCKDCVHYNEETAICYYHSRTTMPEAFCSDGERLVK